MSLLEDSMNIYKIVNYTPHEVRIIRGGGAEDYVIPSSGVARCDTRSEVVGRALSWALEETVYGEVTGLPDPQDGVLVLVSGLVLDHPSTAGRRDLVAPGKVERGPDGQVIGCTTLRVRRAGPTITTYQSAQGPAYWVTLPDEYGRPQAGAVVATAAGRVSSIELAGPQSPADYGSTAAIVASR